ADARTDIYAFGCVFYEMLTGARVGTPQRGRIRPRKLERIVNRCIEEDPGQRWQSAAELQKELSAVSPANRKAFVATGAAAILALAATGGYFFLHRLPKLTVKDTVVLGDFENHTGEPVFDQTLRQGIAVQLEQSPFLSLVSEQQIQQALRFMN